MKMPHRPPTAPRRATRPQRLLPLLVLSALLSVCAPQAIGATGPTDGSLQAVQPGPGGSTPTVSVTAEQCLATGEQDERSATFSGEMTALPGTARMAMRIELQEWIPGEETFHTVSAPGLGVWRGSQPGVKIYKYVKQVTNLSSPAIYRALVRFHWLNDSGHVIKRAERLTSKCAQPASTTPTTTPPVM